MTFYQDAAVIMTLLLLEAVLSFDNAAVLAAMVRKLPVKDRKKALFYGLAGAYVLRASAILVAGYLIANPIFKVAGGGYLLFISVKHFIQMARARHEHEGEKGERLGFFARIGLPAFVVVIIQVELLDLAFAIDQVVVAVAFTSELHLIIIAAFIGILFLRLAASVLAKVMDWLPILEHMAYAAVLYVGAKLVLLHPFFVRNAVLEPLVEGARTQKVLAGECMVPFIGIQHEVNVGAMPGCEIPTQVSIAITLGLFGIPILLKLLFGIPRSKPGMHEAATSTIAPPPTLEPGMLAAANKDVKSGTREVLDHRTETNQDGPSGQGDKKSGPGKTT